MVTTHEQFLIAGLLLIGGIAGGVTATHDNAKRAARIRAPEAANPVKEHPTGKAVYLPKGGAAAIGDPHAVGVCLEPGEKGRVFAKDGKIMIACRPERPFTPRQPKPRHFTR